MVLTRMQVIFFLGACMMLFLIFNGIGGDNMLMFSAVAEQRTQRHGHFNVFYGPANEELGVYKKLGVNTARCSRQTKKHFICDVPGIISSILR